MGLKLVLDSAACIAPGVWSAVLAPEDAQVMGTPSVRAGATTIVLLPNLSPPDAENGILSFEPAHARVLNIGSSPRAIFVFGREAADEGDEEEMGRQVFGPRVQHDDATYLADLSHLPTDLAETGRQILMEMRSSNGGFFQRTRVGRFVNRPDNFWTVKIQPRDRSLRFTVRGNSNKFPSERALKVYPDRNGYSSFKVSHPAQRDTALTILRAAAL